MRGNWLLGWDVGVVYALVSIGLVVFFMRAEAKRIAVWQQVVLTLAAVVVGLLMFFSTLVNSDIDIFIQKQATDRAVRADLYSLFESDPQYSNLSLTTTHLKIVVVTVSGVVENRSVIESLAEELKAVSEHHAMADVQWKVTCRETGRVTDSIDYWRIRSLSESSG